MKVIYRKVSFVYSEPKICSMLENSNYELNIQYQANGWRHVMSLKITECITKMTILNGKGDVSLVTIADFKLVPLNELVMPTKYLS
jgi:hypothetical protein